MGKPSEELKKLKNETEEAFQRRKLRRKQKEMKEAGLGPLIECRARMKEKK